MTAVLLSNAGIERELCFKIRIWSVSSVTKCASGVTALLQNEPCFQMCIGSVSSVVNCV